ncbi:hypothetical protein WCLP8_2610002 [uncultured Gammaproteobacteria bacterium]
MAVNDVTALLAAAKQAGVPALVLGAAGGDSLTINDFDAIPVERLRAAHEGWLPGYMAGGVE